MATTTIRQKLINYLADAEESKVKAIYTLVQSDITNQAGFQLSDEQLSILDKERQLHISGVSKSYSMDQAFRIIKGQESF